MLAENFQSSNKNIGGDFYDAIEYKTIGMLPETHLNT